MALDVKTIILAVCIVFPITSIAAVIFRFEARRIKRLRLEADDWTILIALVNFRTLPTILNLALPYASQLFAVGIALSVLLS